MRRQTRWIWIAVGTTGAAALLTATRRRSSKTLGPPLAATETPRTTRFGYFGAPRKGPPVHAHQGVDLAAPRGSLVLAVGDGVIVATNSGLGKTVRKLQLDEPANWGDGAQLISAVVYADLGKPLVESGERVSRGDALALVDKTGFVHFAVKTRDGKRETFIDPARAGFAYAETRATKGAAS